MKKRFFALISAAALLLTACGPSAPARVEDDVLTIVATTYPIYLFADALTDGMEGVEVERLDTGSTSCLHDYALTVNDMKKLDRADIIAINGAGLEEFLEDALATSDARIIDCSEGVELLENASHHHDEHDHSHDDHDHGHFDPHYWMDPANAVIMIENIADGLAQVDPDHGETYSSGCMDECVRLQTLSELMKKLRGEEAIPGLITFHDGFQYFAHAYDLPLLESIEEEAGSEASAREIVEITALVKEHDIPVIFTEVNGSDATANAIARETGCAVAQLSMLMTPDKGTLQDYVNGMVANMETVLHAFGEELA